MASDDQQPGFPITVRCTACGEGRPVSQDPCPECGADAVDWGMAEDGPPPDRPELGDGMAPFE